MTRKYFKEMVESTNNQIEKSVMYKSSGVEEPKTPVLKTQKPLISIPHLTLDLEFSEEESDKDKIAEQNAKILPSTSVRPVKKMIFKGKFLEIKKNTQKNEKKLKFYEKLNLRQSFQKFNRFT